MQRISVIDEIQLKQDFKDMYKEIGEVECYQVLYELLKSAELLCEVLKENAEKES